MSNDLYFISILVRALADPRRGSALHDAFEQIQSLGRRPEFSEGYRQFERFMEAAAPLQETESNERQMLAEGIVRNLIDDLADGALEGDVDAKALALEFIRSRAEWQAEYESRLRHFEEEDVQEARFAIILEDRRRHTRSIEFSREGGVGSFGDIMPGSYTLSLDTGLLLWQGELTQSDLLWAEAFPDEPLAMAAETEEAAGRPTIEEALLDGSIRLRVFPGVESGRMEIQAKPFPGIGA